MDSGHGKLHAKALATSFKLNINEGKQNHANKAKLGKNIINLSNIDLSPTENNLLSRGLSFVPTPQITKAPILQAAEIMSRRLKLYNYFTSRPALQNTYQKLPFTGKSTWSPSDINIDPDVLACISNIMTDLNNIKVQPEKHNVSREEMVSLTKLRQNNSIVIKKADKGSSIVIMNKEDYLYEGYRQLGNTQHYQPLTEPIFMETSKLIEDILKDLKDASYISDKQFNYLKPDKNPRPRRLYMLPKIHKPIEKWTIPNKIPTGRPIVSDCNSESERIAAFIDAFIKDKAIRHPAYIKDTYDFVETIIDLDIPKGALLITLDVESMYTNIDHDKGLEAIANVFEECEKTPKFYAVMKLLELSLKRNDFEFDERHFIQVSGTSMGKKWAPHYADIFMAKFEKDSLAKCRLKPHFWRRFLDDIFMIWTHGIQAFQEFLDILNSHLPPIKFKAVIHDTTIDFLDTTTFKDPDNEQQLLTKVYFKPTDTHELLYKESFHPKHTFKGVLKSQIIRYHKICSRELDFEVAWKVLYKALSKRRYSTRWLRKVKNETLVDLHTKDRIDLVHMCNPSSSKFGARACGGNRCMTCKIISKCQNFTSTNTKETFAINTVMDCESSNIIYLYTCKYCHIQYVGETGNCLRNRANAHRSAIHTHNSENPLYSHLQNYHHHISKWNDDHFFLIPIEQVEQKSTRILTKMERLKRETFWIDILNTFDKAGLNSRKLDHLIKPKKRDFIPFVVPYSKTANLAAKIIKHHVQKLQDKDEFDDFDYNIVTAYSRHKNLKQFLVSSKLK